MDMKITSSGCYERKSEEHLDPVKDSVPLKPVKKKRKTSAERQREYRQRRKKLKEAQNINKDKPPKKTRAEYQRAYRIRKKLKKLNDNNLKSSSSSADESSRLEEGFSGSESSQPLRPGKKKRKTSAERQREYRQRRKKLKEAQNKDKPPKKTRAEYQRAYRIRKKLKRLNEINTNLNSDTDMILRQDGLSGYMAPLCTAQLAPSSPDAEPITVHNNDITETLRLPSPNKYKKSSEKLRIIQKFKRNQQFPENNQIFFSSLQHSVEDNYIPGDVCEVLIKEEQE